MKGDYIQGIEAIIAVSKVILMKLKILKDCLNSK